jgi:hypothetical protein
MRSKLHSIRETVAALRATLLAPSIEGIEAEMPALQRAAAMLESLRREAPDKHPASSKRPNEELEALSRELRAVGKLIAQGVALTQGMARLLAPPTAGYCQDGEPATFRTPGTVLERG